MKRTVKNLKEKWKEADKTYNKRKNAMLFVIRRKKKIMDQARLQGKDHRLTQHLNSFLSPISNSPG